MLIVSSYKLKSIFLINDLDLKAHHQIKITDMKSQKELESEYETLTSQIELLEKRLVPTKEQLHAYKLKNKYNIPDKYLKNIRSFTVKANYNEISSGEYHLSGSGFITICYDYERPKDGGEVKVEYTVVVSYEQNYDNRYEPYISADKSLKVIGDTDYYQEDGLVECKENDGRKINWAKLLNEIIIAVGDRENDMPDEWIVCIQSLL